MKKRQLAILGSTGSIGTQALEVVSEHSDLFEVYALTANNQVDLLINQARKYMPEVVVIANERKYPELKEALEDLPIKVWAGADAIAQMVQSEPIDMVLTAMVGYSGLRPTISAIKAGKAIALANKETLVVAGELIMKLAAEHEYGVYGKTVKNNPDISDADKAYIFEQLKANFNGECSEVGMYLCMARIAHREGYPEIGLYWEKAAHEEAEHAAKFAELLGEVVTDSTQKNLQMRVDAENGATAGKFELAKLAKKYNLDAIHDTVHEMARDEARHGKAFEGLLKRYFNK